MPKVVDHDLRREEIAEAAWRVIARHGLHAATVREIASEARSSTGVLAHYFRDKDELLLYALRLATERTARRMAHRIRGASEPEALRAVLLEALPLDDERQVEWRIWLSFWGYAVSDTLLTREQKKRYAQWRGLVRNLILACQRQGAIRHGIAAEEEADSIVALIDGIGIQATFEPDRVRPEHQTALVDRYLSRLAKAGD